MSKTYHHVLALLASDIQSHIFKHHSRNILFTKKELLASESRSKISP
jgi:hypothetical protein